MRANEFIREAEATDVELRQRWGEFEPKDKPMLPTTKVGGAPAPTLWSAYEAIQSILGRGRVTDDDDAIEPGMYYVYQSNEPPMFKDTEDSGPGGSINIPNLESKAARDVAVAVHEACHAYVHDRTQGGGRVHANEKIINNLAEKWLRKNLSGPALHVALETITGSRISYGSDHMPKENFIDTAIDTVKKTFTPNNPVKDMRDKVQTGQVKDAGSNSVFQKMSDRNKEMQQSIDAATKENFADGKNSQDKGDSKRHGVPTKASISTLRDVAKQGGRKGQLAHWMANMKAGKAKKK